MDNAQLLYATIELVIFLIPVGTLIWKAAKLAGRDEEQEHRIKRLETELNELNTTNDLAQANIISSLQEIKVSIARLETKIEEREKKEKHV